MTEKWIDTPVGRWLIAAAAGLTVAVIVALSKSVRRWLKKAWDKIRGNNQEVQTFQDATASSQNPLVRQYRSRKEVAKKLKYLHAENQKIWSMYGPETEDQYDPESSAAVTWKRKVVEQIIPNNRVILDIIDKNMNLVKSDEIEIVAAYRQHVMDMEDKHLRGILEAGRRFPTEVLSLFE